MAVEDVLQQVLRMGKGSQKAIAQGLNGNYRGVCWHKENNKFRARVVRAGKRCFLGRYTTAEEAARAYDAVAYELHGRYGRSAAGGMQRSCGHPVAAAQNASWAGKAAHAGAICTIHCMMTFRDEFNAHRHWQICPSSRRPIGHYVYLSARLPVPETGLNLSVSIQYQSHVHLRRQCSID